MASIVSRYIANRIRVIRAQSRMSQEAFGQALGVTQQAISKMEKGGEVTSTQLVEFGRVLGVSPTFFFEGLPNVEIEFDPLPGDLLGLALDGPRGHQNRGNAISKEIGHRLRTARVVRGLSQRELGESFGGVTQAAISAIERGSELTGSDLAWLSELLDVPIGYFFDGLEDVHDRRNVA